MRADEDQFCQELLKSTFSMKEVDASKNAPLFLKDFDEDVSQLMVSAADVIQSQGKVQLKGTCIDLAIQFRRSPCNEVQAERGLPR